MAGPRAGGRSAMAYGKCWHGVRLRRVFATLMAGSPFDPGNVRRLQEIGHAVEVLGLAGDGGTAVRCCPR